MLEQMGLECNIDAKGKALRLVSGMVLLTVAVVVGMVWAWPGDGWLAWGVVVGLAAVGGFQVFEGWARWCVLRAMGFRTRF
jgi:hypothetical protein